MRSFAVFVTVLKLAVLEVAFVHSHKIHLLMRKLFMQNIQCIYIFTEMFEILFKLNWVTSRAFLRLNRQHKHILYFPLFHHTYTEQSTSFTMQHDLHSTYTYRPTVHKCTTTNAKYISWEYCWQLTSLLKYVKLTSLADNALIFCVLLCLIPNHTAICFALPSHWSDEVWNKSRITLCVQTEYKEQTSHNPVHATCTTDR